MPIPLLKISRLERQIYTYVDRVSYVDLMSTEIAYRTPMAPIIEAASRMLISFIYRDRVSYDEHVTPIEKHVSCADLISFIDRVP
jgi:hypothetical protein